MSVVLGTVLAANQWASGTAIIESAGARGYLVRSAIFVLLMLASASPISIPALYLWVKSSRAFPSVERNLLLRIPGLTAFGVLVAVVFSASANFLTGERFNFDDFQFQLELHAAQTRYWFGLFVVWAVLPRLMIPQLRRSLLQLAG